MEKQLEERSGGKCELCSAQEELHQLIVSPRTGGNLEDCVAICSKCQDLINGDASDSNHWRCLNDSMWSEFSAVKVQVWRLLNSIKEEGWPIDLLDMMYLSEEEMAWAKAEDEKVFHLDSNGVELKAGDSVTIIASVHIPFMGFASISLVSNTRPA